MDGWTILIGSAVCGGGVLTFVRIVACEVERVAQDLTRVELLMKRVADRNAGAEDGEIIDTTAA